MATYRKPHRVGLKADGLRGAGRNTPLEFITPRYEAGLKAAEIPIGAAAPGLTISQTNLVAHYRSDQGVTESGGAVSQWDDIADAGNNWHLTEATNTPTLVASQINGHDVIRFDGTSGDHLHNSSVAITNPFHVYFLFKTIVWTGDRFIWGGGNNSESPPHNILNTSEPEVRQGEAVGEFNPVNATVGTAFLINGQWNGSDTKQALNDGSYVDTGGSGTPNMAQFGLSGKTKPANVEFAEFALYSALITGDAHTANIAYFQQRYELW